MAERDRDGVIEVDHEVGNTCLSFSFIHQLTIVCSVQAIRIFLSEVNEERTKYGESPIGTATAVKFLMARKFDVSRALLLYRAHQVSVAA